MKTIGAMTLIFLLGFTSAGFSEGKESQLRVRGMFCDRCVSKVQKTLNTTPGVHSASVNLLKNTATVHFNEAKIDLEKIAEIVTDAGFEATVAR